MLFNSLSYLVFFGAVLTLHYLPISWTLKKWNLLVASYLFYAAWNPPFVLLLGFSTAVDWVAAGAMGRTTRPPMRRLLLGASLLVNLGLLGYFKYADFALRNFVELARVWGFDYQPAPLDIALPIGISFYTFQTLSYTIDVYRGEFKPWPSLLDFALYVSFFPQLVAGPIVRARQFLPQCREPKRAAPAEFAWGLNLLIVGLFSKIVLADRVFRPAVDAVFHPAVRPDFASAWCGTMAFCGQIYCDFAGYSTCAIGSAMCLGFALPDNFRWPVASVGFIDFWRRWHISLSTWLRDYVYISLGGNRHGSLRGALNLLTTMLLAGLWHGASWTFVTFGGLHGAALVAENRLRGTSLARRPFWKHPLAQFVLAAGTLVLLGGTCIFFRSTTMAQAAGIAAAMLGSVPSTAVSCLTTSQSLAALIPLEVLFVVHFLMRDHTLEEVAGRCPPWLWGALLAGMLASLVLIPGEEHAFVYFQF